VKTQKNQGVMKLSPRASRKAPGVVPVVEFCAFPLRLIAPTCLGLQLLPGIGSGCFFSK
jgi:hypothetical protein